MKTARTGGFLNLLFGSRIALLLFVTVSGVALGQNGLTGNAKAVVISPPLEWKYTLGGYGARMNKPAEAIHDDIKAKALVLKEKNRKYVIITMDILGIPSNVKPMVIEKLGDPSWGAENILILPSHSHTSLEMFALNDRNIFGNPALGIFQPQLLEFVVEKLAGLIRETDSDLKPISVGTQQVKLDGLNRNRRGDSWVDNELTVTRVDLTNGRPLAVLVNWTAHPTITDEKDMWLSAEWPGYLQRELEQWIGAGIVAMYYNGAEGDQSVIAENGGSHYETTEMYGRTIAKQAYEAYIQINLEKDPVFEYQLKTVDLSARKPHPDFMKTGGTEYQLSEEKIQGLLDYVFPAQTSIPVLRLGNLMIIGAPGEMIAELGIDIKNKVRASGVPNPAIGGLANEWISYILSENQYQKGGYESSASFYGPTLGSVIHDTMIEAAIETAK